jgi:long-chain acyl-CoA synthetase
MPSLYQSLERLARPHLDRTALATPDGRSWTYRELFSRATSVATRLHSLGLRPGDRVAFLLPNSPEYAAALLGCFRAGVIASPLDPRCTPRELWQQARLVTPKLLVVPPRLSRVLGPIARLAGIPRTRSVDELTAPATHHAPPAVVDSASPAEILFTSGTTGGTKGVVLSHGALLWNALAGSRATGVNPRDRSLAVLPFFHSFGSTANLFAVLSRGGSLEVHPRFSPPAVYGSLAAGRLTILPAVPAIYALLVKEARARGRRLRLDGLRCISGGAALPPRVAREFTHWFGVPIAEGYGLTEAGPIVSVDDARKPARGTVGRALPGVRVSVRADGRALPAGRVGEVWARSPSLMLGYWNDELATRRSLVDGWLRTGDHGRLDGRGRLSLTGREREFVNVGGDKVWPREVEEVLEEHPAVAEAAIVPSPDPVMGEVVHAYVVAREGRAVSPGELTRHCRALLSPHKVPRRFTFAHALPRTRVGKVDRLRLSGRR